MLCQARVRTIVGRDGVTLKPGASKSLSFQLSVILGNPTFIDFPWKSVFVESLWNRSRITPEPPQNHPRFLAQRAACIAKAVAAATASKVESRVQRRAVHACRCPGEGVRCDGASALLASSDRRQRDPAPTLFFVILTTHMNGNARSGKISIQLRC